MSLCPLGDKTYEHITSEWLKLSPEAAELYVSHLIPLELRSIENKINIKNFIIKFSEAFCNKQSGEEFASLIRSGIESINLCLLRNDIPYCERDKIRRLLIDIEYNLYYNKIVEVENQTNIISEPSPKKVKYNLIQSDFNKKPILEEEVGCPLDVVNAEADNIQIPEESETPTIPQQESPTIPQQESPTIPQQESPTIPITGTKVQNNKNIVNKPEGKIEIKITELILITFILIFLGLILLVVNNRHIKFTLYDVSQN